MKNALNWFEIPVTDMERALKFYNAILEANIEVTEGMGDPIAFLPSEEGGVGGALALGEIYKPSQEGALVYLNGGDDLSAVLGRVEAAGGQVVLPKTGIGENGFIAFFIDSEGNRVGLHSMG